jgi:hypothetical protein
MVKSGGIFDLGRARGEGQKANPEPDDEPENPEPDGSRG